MKVAGGRDIYVVLKGAGELLRKDYGLYTTLFLEKKNERASFEASEPTEMLHFHLPDLAPVRARHAARSDAGSRGVEGGIPLSRGLPDFKQQQGGMGHA